MRLILAWLWLAAALASCTTVEAPPRAAEPRQMFVVAANPLAAQAGMNVLRRGGSAVDAAVAVQAMLSLVEPQSSGLGGGTFLHHPETPAYGGDRTPAPPSPRGAAAPSSTITTPRPEA